MFFFHLKTGHHSLPLFGRFCNTVFLWNSTSVLWTNKISPTLSQHEGEQILTKLSFLGELPVLKVLYKLFTLALTVYVEASQNKTNAHFVHSKSVVCTLSAHKTRRTWRFDQTVKLGCADHMNQDCFTTLKCQKLF